MITLKSRATGIAIALTLRCHFGIGHSRSVGTSSTGACITFLYVVPRAISLSAVRKQFRPWHAPLFVFDVPRSCFTGPPRRSPRDRSSPERRRGAPATDLEAGRAIPSSDRGAADSCEPQADLIEIRPYSRALTFRGRRFVRKPRFQSCSRIRCRTV